MKQTAVEWFAKELNKWRIKEFGLNAVIGIPTEVFEQAKQLEKQQIIQAHEDAYMDCGFEYSASDCANNYYKERYDKI
jgi:hypothetical protein